MVDVTQDGSWQFGRAVRAFGEWLFGAGLLRWHALLFAIGGTTLAFIRLYDDPTDPDFRRPLIIWGVIFATHLAVVLLLAFIAYIVRLVTEPDAEAAPPQPVTSIRPAVPAPTASVPALYSGPLAPTAPTPPAGVPTDTFTVAPPPPVATPGAGAATGTWLAESARIASRVPWKSSRTGAVRVGSWARERWRAAAERRAGPALPASEITPPPSPWSRPGAEEPIPDAWDLASARYTATSGESDATPERRIEPVFPEGLLPRDQSDPAAELQDDTRWTWMEAAAGAWLDQRGADLISPDEEIIEAQPADNGTPPPGDSKSSSRTDWLRNVRPVPRTEPGTKPEPDTRSSEPAAPATTDDKPVTAQETTTLEKPVEPVRDAKTQEPSTQETMTQEDAAQGSQDAEISVQEPVIEKAASKETPAGETDSSGTKNSDSDATEDISVGESTQQSADGAEPKKSNRGGDNPA